MSQMHHSTLVRPWSDGTLQSPPLARVGATHAPPFMRESTSVEPSFHTHRRHGAKGMASFLLSDGSHRFSMTIMASYFIFVSAQLSLVSEVTLKYHIAFWGVDCAVLLIYLGFSVARMYSFGPSYARKPWTIIDVALNILALVLLFSVDYSLEDIVLFGTFRVDPLIRVLWLFISAERALRHFQVIRPLRALAHKRKSYTSPLEQCIEELNHISEFGHLPPETKIALHRVTNILSNGDLFRPLHTGFTEGVDSETAAWMNEFMEADLRGPTPRHGCSASSSRMPSRNDDDDEDDDDDDGFGGSRSSRSASASADRVPALKKLHKTRSMQLMVRQQLKGYGARDQLLDLLHSPSAAFASRRPSEAHRQANAWLWSLFMRAARLRKSLKDVNEWVFNLFGLQDITHGRPLYALCRTILFGHDVPVKLRLDTTVLQRLLLRIEAGYNSVPYHNVMHAADVVQSTHYLLIQPFLLPFMSSLHILGAVLAAAAHDYGHPGVNNAFEIATRSDLATRYNDQAVLENMHCSSLFELLRQENLNALAGLNLDDYKKIRSLIVAMILETDMAKHFESFAKFKGRLVQFKIIAPPAPLPAGTSSSDTGVATTAAAALISNAADAQFFLQIAIHTADVSNPAKPLTFYRHWVRMVMTEFYAQGDQERDAGLPISTFFDRLTPNIPKFQLGFIDFIVGPLFNEWAKIVEDVARTVIPLLNMNRAFWDREATRAAAQHEHVTVHVPADAILPGALPATSSRR